MLPDQISYSWERSLPKCSHSSMRKRAKKNGSIFVIGISKFVSKKYPAKKLLG